MKINSTLLSEGQQPIINDYVPQVNDELATVNDSKSIVDSLESADGNQNFGVNDDLAQFSEATISIRPRPNKNDLDPERASGSFVFPAGRSVSVVRLCQIILQPIFNAVEQFQNRKEEGTQKLLQLLPVRNNKNNKRYTR